MINKELFSSLNPTPNFGLFRAGYIYALKCPDKNIVRYIGKSFSLRFRMNCHLSVKQTERSKRANWIKSLLKQGKHPIMEIIDECDEFNWEEKEKAYIKLYKSCGANLLNMTEGGESGCLNFNHEPSTRAKISEGMRAYKKSDLHNNKVSDSIKNKWKNDPDYRKNQVVKNLEKISKMTIEHRKKAGLMKSKMARMPVSEKIKMCNDIRTEISKGKTRELIASEFGISYGILKELIKKY